jgi:uncharacterized protein YbcI
VSDIQLPGSPRGAGPHDGMLAAISNAMMALHKQQFGRGPTRARSGFSNDQTLVCTLEDALLPAERAMVEMGQQVRVMEGRLFFQTATRAIFIDAIEEIVGRKVVAFSSAIDPAAAVVWEIFKLQAGDAHQAV